MMSFSFTALMTMEVFIQITIFIVILFIVVIVKKFLLMMVLFFVINIFKPLENVINIYALLVLHLFNFCPTPHPKDFYPSLPGLNRPVHKKQQHT